MSTVNSQVTDSVTQVNGMNVGIAPSVAMGMTYVAMADSIAKVMGNATTAQQNMQITSNAATTTAVAMILAQGASSS